MTGLKYFVENLEDLRKIIYLPDIAILYKPNITKLSITAYKKIKMK